jgi:arylsulfatase A-like enzyme
MMAAAVRKWVPTSVWIGMSLQTLFLVALYATDGYDMARTGEVRRLAATYLTVAALFLLVHVIAGARKRLVWVGNVALYTVFVAVNFARFETTGAFDYGFAHENVRELMTPLGRRIVTAQVKPLEIALLLIVPLALGILAIRRWPSPAWPLSRRWRALAACGCVALVVGFPAARVGTHESVTSFATSAYRFHADSARARIAVGAAAYPFVHEFAPSERAGLLSKPNERRPHVIVLFLESWSDIYTDRNARDGRPYTPVYNARRQDGLTFNHFYASSIQSSRGRFATMCSLIPLYRGKEFNDLADAPLHCLPHVLGQAGYETLIYSASDEPAFERSQEFFGHIGFTDVRFEDPAKRAADPRVWGAGLQDDAYYRKLFTLLDEKAAKTPGSPLFAVAINASNHYPFDKNPAHVPDPEGSTKYSRNYVASLRAADGWLTTFFEELDRRPAFRDAIVVMVGDHSFPADEHGIHFNALGAREESFRTGFALRWKGHVAPAVVRDRAASQLDLAPTIIDLLQLKHTSHFVGRSLVAEDDGAGPVPAPAPLVQPYDGVRLGAVLYPFKLEVHDSAQQEHLYDLSKDPDEANDLLGNAALEGETAILRGTIARIRESQAILRAKRVWPGTKTDEVSISR